MLGGSFHVSGGQVREITSVHSLHMTLLSEMYQNLRKQKQARYVDMLFANFFYKFIILGKSYFPHRSLSSLQGIVLQKKMSFGLEL